MKYDYLPTKKNVLIFPGENEVGIEIYTAIKENIHFRGIGLSTSFPTKAKMTYNKGDFFLGEFNINDENIIKNLNRLIDQENIDFIFPTHDVILLFLSRNRELIKAKIICSSATAVEIACSKRKTYQIFEKHDFCPIVIDIKNKTEHLEYPFYGKENYGYGSRNNFLINNKLDLNNYLNLEIDLVFTEFLPGEEFSVDCFSNLDNELLFVGPRSREQIKKGMSNLTSSKKVDEEIYEIASKINIFIRPVGVWFFQVKQTNTGKLKLLEIGLRPASNFGLHRLKGVNLSLLTLFLFNERKVNIFQNNAEICLERILVPVINVGIFYNHVYVDLDETLIFQNRINIKGIEFIYTLMENNIKVTLITKHRYEINLTLEKYAISKNLFNEIIVLKENEEKIDFILPENAIFIDNYFQDRWKCFDKYKIPVFDADAFEGLTNTLKIQKNANRLL